MVHIGLGAFHRAHQAWYTDQVDAAGRWGIAAFTGRSPTAAEQLNAQDGVYTVITRGPQQDEFEFVGSIVEAHDGADLQSLAELLSRGSTAVVTLTITEAGYYVVAGADGPQLDSADPVVTADVASLGSHSRAGFFDSEQQRRLGEQVRSAAARLVVGLAARRAAEAGPLAVVSCDNLPDNGAAARAAVVGTAQLVDQDLAAWIVSEVSFVSTSIDRITPGATESDQLAVEEATGRADRAPVVTEPFTSWVLCGEFPAGRPSWEEAGALFVEDLGPFQRRKLWMLNGAHSLMAYAGRLRGHSTVAEALADSVVSGWVEQLWDAAASHFTDPQLGIEGYREALRRRFANPRIAHHLADIGVDGSVKLAARAVPILEAERAAERTGTAALRVIAAWMDQTSHQLASGQHLQDPAAEWIAAVVSTGAQTGQLLGVVDAGLAEDADLVAAIHQLRGTFTA